MVGTTQTVEYSLLGVTEGLETLSRWPAGLGPEIGQIILPTQLNPREPLHVTLPLGSVTHHPESWTILQEVSTFTWTSPCPLICFPAKAFITIYLLFTNSGSYGHQM